MHTLTFITGNPGKVNLVNQYLDFPVVHKFLDLVEAQPLDLATIVEHKAKEAWQKEVIHAAHRTLLKIYRVREVAHSKSPY